MLILDILDFNGLLFGTLLGQRIVQPILTQEKVNCEWADWHEWEVRLCLPCGVLGGGNANIFLFSPLPGEMIHFDEHIFQMGCFNHQLVTDIIFSKNSGLYYKHI